MSRTQGRVDGDTGYGDGHIFFSALDGTLTLGAGTATRNGSGSFSLNIGASATTVLTIPLSALLFRYGVQDWLQEQFGSGQAGGAQGFSVGGATCLSTASASAGTSVAVTVNTTVGFTAGRDVLAGTQKTSIVSITDGTHMVLAILTATLASNSIITENLFTTPAGVTGPPPFTGTTQFTPVTAPRPKGIGIKAIYPVYAIAGASLTLNTIGLTKTVFTPGNTAPVVTSLLADAANGLGTATNAQPYLTPINFATPVPYQVSKYSEYSIEWDVTTAAGGSVQLFGIFIDVAYNYV